MAREQSVVARGIWPPDQRGNPGPLHWDHGVSAPGPPGKPLWAPFMVPFLAPHHLPSSLSLGTEGERGTTALALGLGT